MQSLFENRREGDVAKTPLHDQTLGLRKFTIGELNIVVK
jgi:hypothetical protein